MKTQAENLSEKVQTAKVRNEKEKHHLLTKLTDKINFITNEIKAFDINIEYSKKHIERLEHAKKKRQKNLEKYKKRKAETLALTFDEKEQETKHEQTENKVQEKDQKVEKLKNKLKEKGFSLDDLIEKL